MASVAANQYRVLIVDDEEPVRRFVTRVLQQPGYETDTAASGLDAAAQFEKGGPYDLLVTDFAMPGMTGGELAQRLRATTPTLKVLYLTGYSDRVFQNRTLLADGEAFLEKPASVQGLLEAVALLLVGRIPPPRSARVKVAGGHVRLPNETAELVNVSMTGMLVQTTVDLAVGATMPLIIELPLSVILVAGRVVSSRTAESSGSDAAGKARYHVAFHFTDVSADASHALRRLCGTEPTQLHR